MRLLHKVVSSIDSKDEFRSCILLSIVHSTRLLVASGTHRELETPLESSCNGASFLEEVTLDVLPVLVRNVLPLSVSFSVFCLSSLSFKCFFFFF